MRRARITFVGAYHHVMNRGINKENIFPDVQSKRYFIATMVEKAKIHKIKIYVYCVMDNHYHILLQNSSGHMSQFMKDLNGQYGTFYRNWKGGAGYVFQSRFKSTLIQKEAYLQKVAFYILLNPVRKSIVKFPWQYRWSSINEYFDTDESRARFVDATAIKSLYESNTDMRVALRNFVDESLPIRKTRFGDILGNDDFVEEAKRLYDRRLQKNDSRRMRLDEHPFMSPESAINEFEKNRGIKVEELNLTSHHGRRLRAELLVVFKDQAGMKYSDIIKHPIFKSLKYTSLGQLYKKAKKRKTELVCGV